MILGYGEELYRVYYLIGGVQHELTFKCMTLSAHQRVQNSTVAYFKSLGVHVNIQNVEYIG